MEPITFGQFDLVVSNGSITGGATALQWGPDGLLYVVGYIGSVYAIEVTKSTDINGDTTGYTGQIKWEHDLSAPNFDDFGNVVAGDSRQALGIAVTEDEATGETVLYVSHSDIQIGAGNNGGEGDINLDTNSGVVTRIKLDTSDVENINELEAIDLIRGLPRSEENHATNGLALTTDDEGNPILLIASGGHANAGAPSTNFVGLPEYSYSASMLSADLTQLAEIEADKKIADPNIDHVFDLPTLDDPTRPNFQENGVDVKIDANFDGVPDTVAEFVDEDDDGIPDWLLDQDGDLDVDADDVANFIATKIVDADGNGVRDTILYQNGGSADDNVTGVRGGNDALNQAKLLEGNPVQVYSTGYRNIYDVLVTEDGRKYTYDNGANGGWGGVAVTTDGVITNAPNNVNQTQNFDQLHEFDKGVHSGHPNPTQASGPAAGLWTSPTVNGPSAAPLPTANWRQLSDTPLANLGQEDDGLVLPADWDEIVDPSLINPAAGVYNEGGSVADGALDADMGSWNGLAEYTGTAFGGQLQGAILATKAGAPGGSNVKWIKRDVNGNIDVVAQGGGDLSNPDTIIEAANQGSVGSTGKGNTLGIDAVGDVGVDGVLNGQFNNTIWVGSLGGTNKITVFEAGGEPAGADLDKDDDGIDHIFDYYEYSAVQGVNHVLDSQGTTTEINAGETRLYTLSAQSFDLSAPGGIGSLGYMVNLEDPSAEGGLLSASENIIPGGAGSGLQIKDIRSGTAKGSNNDQRDALTFAVSPGNNAGRIEISTKMISIQTGFYQDGSESGLQIGTGDQFSFMSLVLAYSDTGTPGLSIDFHYEESDIEQTTQSVDVSNLLTNDDGLWRLNNEAVVEFLFDVDTISGLVTPKFKIIADPLNPPANFTELAAVEASGDVLDALQGNFVVNGQPHPLAFGNIGTSAIDPSAPAQTLDGDDVNVTYSEFKVVGFAPQVDAFVTITDITTDETAGTVDLTVALEDELGNAVTLTENVTVEYTFAGNIDIPADAIVTPATPITINSGDSTATISVAVVDDAIVEGPETLDVVLGSATAGDLTVLAKAGEDIGTVTINDNDFPEPGSVIYRVNAGTGTNVTSVDSGLDWLGDANLIGSNGTGIVVSGNTGDVFSQILTNEEAEMDLTNLVSPVPWQLFVNERGDNTVDETTLDYSFDVTEGVAYTVTIYYVENWHNIFLGGPRVFDVSLEGSVPPEFDDIHPLREATDVIAGASEPLPNFANTGINTINATTDLKQPYLGTAFSKSVTYTATDDTLNLSFIHNDPVQQNPKINAIEVSVADPGTDGSVAVVSVDDVTVNEGDSTATVTFSLSAPVTEGVVTVPFTVADGSAVAGSDFTAPGPLEVVFDGVQTATATFAIVDDIDTEVTEDFTVTIDAGGITAAVGATVTVGNGTATVSIVDNDIVPPVDGEVLYRVNAGGPAVIATDDGPDWGEDTGDFGTPGNSPYLTNVPVGNTTYDNSAASSYPGNVTSTVGDVPASTPLSVFDTERGDRGSDAPTMQWQFDVASDYGLQEGDQVEVRLYFAEIFGGIEDAENDSDMNGNGAGNRVFDVAVDGFTPTEFDNIDQFAEAGANTGFVRSYVAAVDAEGLLDLEFINGVENPSIKAIEIVAVNENALQNVTIAAQDVSTGEATNEITITFTISEAVASGDITVPFTLVDVTTTVGEDYGAGQNGEVTFSAGFDNDQTRVITLINDDDIELPESFTVVLGIPTAVPANVNVTTVNGTATIISEDAAPAVDSFNDVAAEEDDWSNDNTASDDVTLMEGPNTLVSTGSLGDADYITFEVPVGQQVTSITLTDYEGGGDATFLGIQIGGTLPTQTEILDGLSEGAILLDGGTIYNVMEQGTDLLEVLSSTSVEGNGLPTNGLVIPLQTGTYTLWFNQNTGPTASTLEIVSESTIDPNDIDGDGIANIQDPFAFDSTNGDSKVLLAGVEFTQGFDTATDDPFDADGGFSGILVNPDFTPGGSSVSDPYGDRTSGSVGVDISGGTLNVLSQQFDAFQVPGPTAPPAIGANNTLKDGYQSAVDVTGVDNFEVHARASSTDWLGKTTSTSGFEQFGITLGAGGVDDFVKLVISDNNTDAANPQLVQLAHNNSLTLSEPENYALGAANGPTVDITLVGNIEFRLIVDKVAGTVTGKVDFFASADEQLLESFETDPATILAGSSLEAALNGQNPLTGGDGGLAYGIFVSDWGGGSNPTANQFTASYDFLTVRALDDIPVPTVSISGTPTATEMGDIGTQTALVFDLAYTGADVTRTIDYTVNGVAASASVDFAGGVGTLSVLVENDDTDTGTDSIAVVLTAVSDGDAVDATLNSATGTVTEDDVVVPPAEPIRIQAESFTSSITFGAQTQSAAEGGEVAFLPNNGATGSATYDLAQNGVLPSSYTVILGYFDENDGVSTLDLVIDSTSIGSITLDDPNGGNAAQPTSFRTATFSDVAVGENSALVINGTSGGGEYARIDWIEFVPATTVTPENTAPFAPSDLPDQNALEDAEFSFDAGALFADAEEDALTFSATTVGSDGGLVSAAGLPDGVTFDANTGVFAGAPTTAGTYAISVIAGDGALDSAPETFTLAVSETNEAPTLVQQISNQTLGQGAAVALDVSGNFFDPDGDVLTYTVDQGSLPAGITFQDGVFGGSVDSAAAPGSYQVTVTAADNFEQVSDTFLINVTGVDTRPTVRIEAEDVGPGEMGTLVDGFFVESGSRIRLFTDDTGEAAYDLSGVAPGDYIVRIGHFDENDGESTIGVQITSNGQDTFVDSFVLDDDETSSNAGNAASFREKTLQGTVTLGTDGVLILTAQADSTSVAEAGPNDTVGQEFARIDYIELIPVGGDVNFAPTQAGGGISDTTVQGLGGINIDIRSAFSDPEDDVLTYAKVTGPAWVDVSSDGRVIGIPPAGGTFEISISATDANNPTLPAISSFSLTVDTSGNQTPQVITPIGTIVLDQDAPIEQQASFSDPDGDDALLTYSLDPQAPDWLSIDPIAGVLAGSPGNDDVGEVTVNVIATDELGGQATDMVMITVKNANDAPEVGVALTDQSASQGALFTYALPAGAFTDIDLAVDATEQLTYSATLDGGLPLPAWLSIDPLTGTLSGAPDSDLDLSVVVTATDEAGASVSAAPISIVVDPIIVPVDPVTIEAEDFTALPGNGGSGALANYTVNALSGASGGELIRAPSTSTQSVIETDVGSAPGITPGGTYKIGVTFVDETDGISTATVLLDSVAVGTWTFDGTSGSQINPGAATGTFQQPGNFRFVEFDSVVPVQNTSVLRLEVQSQGGEFGRIDSVTLTPAELVENQAPSAVIVTPVDGFENGIPEDADTSARIKVADISVVDDGLGSNVLSLSDDILFEIDGSELYLKAGVALDFETVPSLAVSVQVDDAAFAALPDAAAAFSLNVIDVLEPPAISVGVASSTTEGDPAAATLTLSETFAQQITVTLVLSSGLQADPATIDSLANGGDVAFDATGQATLDVTIPADTLSVTVPFEIFQDALDEAGFETYEITITAANVGAAIDGAAVAVPFDATPAEGGILDDDGPVVGTDQVVLRINAGGPTIAVANGPDWLADTPGAGSSAFLSVVDNRNDVDTTPATPGVADVPDAIFATARSSDDAVFSYDIPTSALGGGTDYRVNLYFAEAANSPAFQQVGNRVFDAALEGTTPPVFDDIDVIGLFGSGGGGVLSADVTVNDGVLNLEFLKNNPAVQNAIINGIEIIALGEPVEDTDGPTAVIALTNPETEADPVLVTVTLSDATGIDVATLGAQDLSVTGSAGAVSYLGFADGAATYAIAPPVGGVWQDDAEITVEMLAGAIADTSAGANVNLAVSATLTLDISPVDPTEPTNAQEAFNLQDDIVKDTVYTSGENGAAVLRIMEGQNNVEDSNFSPNSFQVENVGQKKISAIFIDVTTALYPDSVFDPDGQGGDSAAKRWAINTDGLNNTSPTGAFVNGGAIATDNQGSFESGYFLPGEAPAPNSGGSGGASNGGYKGAMIKFNANNNGGFESGEIVGFSGDMDPNSIAGMAKTGTNGVDTGATDNWDVGGISGHELIGSQFTVLFDDGSTASGQLASDTSNAGAIAIADQALSPSTVSLTVNTVTEGGTGTYGMVTPSVIVEGDPGDLVRITLSKGFNPVNNTTNGIADLVDDRLDRYDFEVNNAFDEQSVDVTLGLDGTFDASDLFDYNTTVGTFKDGFVGDDIAPIAFVASVIESIGGGEFVPVGPVTSPIYLTNQGGPVTVDPVNENQAPTAVVLMPVTTSLLETADTSAATVVATIAVTDDGLGTNDLTLTGADANLFEIFDNAGSLELRLVAGADLDFGNNPSLDVTVVVDDITVGETPDASAAFSVAVTELELPTAGEIFLADGGKVVFEAENSDFAGTGWVFETVTQGSNENPDPKGTGYLIWEGGNSFNNPANNSTLSYTFLTDEDGNYTVKGMFGRREEPDPTEANDLFLRLVDANGDALNPIPQVSGSETRLHVQTGRPVDVPTSDFDPSSAPGGDRVVLNNDDKWMKFFVGGLGLNQLNGGGVNGDFGALDVSYNLQANTLYTLQIAGRSDFFEVDRLALSNDGANNAVSLAENGAQSAVLASGPAAPEIMGNTSAVTVSDGATFAFDVDATDDNGDLLTYAISGGADANLFDINSFTGVVSFSTPQAFVQGGDNTYDVQVTVSDPSALSDVRDYAVTVVDGSIPVTVTTPIDSSADDWEEFGGGTSGDLEFGLNGGPQTVGLRFDGLDIPDGAVISAAFIRFTALETSSGDANLVLGIENTENAAGYTNGNAPQDRSTVDDFDWKPEAWIAGQSYQVDVLNLVSGVIGNDGADDAALSFIFRPDADPGSRVAVPFDASGQEPELIISFLDDGV